LALYLCIILTLVLILGFSTWGIYRDLAQVRSTFLELEMNRFRSHAERTVTRLQRIINELPNKLDAINSPAITSFLRDHWQNVRSDSTRSYAAIVSPENKVILHIDPSRQGEILEAAWYDRTVPDAGEDVVETRSRALSGGKRALDVNIPIMLGDTKLGTYHSGLNYEHVENEMATKREVIMETWLVVIGSISVILLTACWALLKISRRIVTLREAIKLSLARRYAEIGQLMSGVVHEIRNPLNAMRLNLHVLSQSPLSPTAEAFSAMEMPRAEHQQIIQESVQEIDRIEGLMRILLGYVRPETPHVEVLDIRREIESTLQFLKPMLERTEIAVTARFPDTTCLVRLDRDRIRQILINLINNAIEATGNGGQIQMQVSQEGEEIEIRVGDDGPGVPLADRERIFEPFYSTKETGTGLGLALVRRYVEEAGGWIRCDANEPRGARFTLRFPAEKEATATPRASAGLTPFPQPSR
jgi:signal transduction histidine kinase